MVLLTFQKHPNTDLGFFERCRAKYIIKLWLEIEAWNVCNYHALTLNV